MAPGNNLPKCADAFALAEALASLCEDPHPDKDSWRARCPNHQGISTTSLSITPADDRVLLKCFGECTQLAIVQALGLTMRDLFVHQSKHKNGDRRLVKIYDYYDADGELRHQTLRYEPKSFSQRRPDPAKPGAFLPNMHNIQPVLYHLPEVLHAVEHGERIFLVEGEKDADILMQYGLTATCNPMGASKWHERYSNTLDSAHVVILPDFDTKGREHAETVARALVGVAADIKIIPDFHTEKVGSDIYDWIRANGKYEDFVETVERAPFYTGPAPAPLGFPSGAPPAPTPEPPPGRVIEQHRHLLPQVVSQAEEALEHMPGAPLVFQRARRLVTIAPAEKTARGITRSQGTPIISALTAPRLRALLAHAAAWLTPSTSKKDQAPRPDMPQPWVVETLLDQEAWPFPPMTGLVNSPTLRPDGSLILTQGYDAETGLWLTWNQETFPAVHETPTREDAQTALRMLVEPFQDFPFAAQHHCVAAIAAVLTLIARYTVQSVPLFAIRATTRGSGKTLLADCIAMIATGRPAPKMPQVKEEEEERKRLLALALDGDPLVVIDNVVGALGNPALDLAVTSQLFKDRLLGKNATKEAPLYTVFLATGNNMFFKGDMARRAIPIDLCPDLENPETRSGFVHPRLLEWIQQERPRLISAALTLLRAYWAAGKPAQPIDPYGSFEGWSDLIRSALVWAGAPDPCAGREGLEAASDETFEAHGELLTVWHACYGYKPTTLTGMIADIQLRGSTGNTAIGPQTATMQQWDHLREMLGFFDPRFDGQKLNSKVLGHALKRLCGRVIHNKRLVKLAERDEYGTKWAVQDAHPRPASTPVLSVFPVFNSVATRGKIQDEHTEISEGESGETNTENTDNTGKGWTPADDADIPF